MGIGRTIRIYLDDGAITGIKHAEIVNWTGQAISSPRTQIKTLSEWPESKKPGVYFLFGVDEESGRQAAYIGEAENVYDRLQNHALNKDFWNEIVFFTSKDENLTKAHVKYLESRLLSLAKSANRYVLQNGNGPQLPVLPRGDRDSMEEFIGNLRTLLGVVGHKVLEAPAGHENEAQQVVIPKPEQDILNLKLRLNVSGILAFAEISDEGIVVLKGSQLSSNTRESLGNGYKKLRDELVSSGIITEHGGKLIFTSNQLFTSPSQAAAVIVGYSINGRNHWCDDSGRTLKNLEEQNV
ncbi:MULTISPECIES: GIY-YIG nuclease family protein [unclassified Methylophaga]|jgi:hypothetical protein|uniref:GIY-YIG nuclease family protein n=2 Tax=Methylophaga TaxID=40222 RepID=UPI000C8C4A0C|nr:MULTISPECIES: GIY-YIG nuclease family protein [unclassified Methylophaga]MAK67715.1 methionine sulfoxide reductase A [Methylophaga sp.]MAY17909.1 methionine sulfoxide reductase A [Methylophaga sp.]MBN45662.1 methionine sulfoxide reductase A [Methylophaga sp.]|tara:strand:+ start:6279 stop:7166 length:888 start_codon:yes stop_codon:yes gene_type:complete